MNGALHHVELYVSDLERSVQFYDWFLHQELGYEIYQQWSEGRSYRKNGQYYIVLVQVELSHANQPYHRKAVGLNHLAFSVDDRSTVDQLTEKLRSKYVSILYEDRHPYAGGPGYYAVYFEDPDRIKLEVVAAGPPP